MGIRSRIVAAALAVVTVTTVAGATTAAAASPATTPSQSAPGKPGKPGVDPVLIKVAASLHVSVQQLVTALGDFKQALGKGESEQAALAGFAQELGVSVGQAKQAMAELAAAGNKGKPGVPDAKIIALLAKDLHISTARARTVFEELSKLDPGSGPITANPGFVAIARSLGITPQRLMAVIVDVKRELAGGSPTK